MSSEALQAFLAALPVGLELPSRDCEELLKSGIAIARDAYPTFDVPTVMYADFVASRWPQDSEPPSSSEVRWPDLYLACGVANSITGAFETMAAQYSPIITSALAKLRVDSFDEDELKQRVLEKVGLGDNAKICSYSGTGPLRAWIRAVAVREALSLFRRQKPDHAVDLELEYVAAPDVAIDILLEKKQIRGMLRECFHNAHEALSAETRALLSFKYKDGRSIDELAKVYRCHRATVARKVAAAREELYSRTKSLLKEKLNISESEFESLMGAVASRLDFTIRWNLSE